MRVSFELFPPKTPEGETNLDEAGKALGALGADYFSVTFGTGGETADFTRKSVARLVELTGADVRPHLSCLPEARVRELLEQYRQMGVRGLVLLRGEVEEQGKTEPGTAAELVALVRSVLKGEVEIAVAAYPELHPLSPSAEEDFYSFRTKVEAGADMAITQLFYNADAYYDFCERCARSSINIPIIAGVMPITRADRLVRICEISGVELPRWFHNRMNSYRDEESLTAWGLEYVTRLCEQLISIGAPGFHFYCMNRAQPVTKLCQNLNLR